MRQSSRAHHRVVVARARRFLRQHLAEELTLPAVARAAAASPYHFARLYHAMTGETVFATLTRLRLERAAALLCDEPARPVSAIALEVGYQTPSAFAKSFRAALGLSPTQLRQAAPSVQRAALESFARAPRPAHTALRAGALTGPALRHRDAARVISVRERGDYGDIAAPLAWNRLVACFAGTGALARFTHIAAIHDDPRAVAPAALRYDAGLLVDEDTPVPPGATAASWPGGAYAVFEHRGPFHQIEAAFESIYRDWIPAAAPPLRDAPSLEIYTINSQTTPEEELCTELWIPVTGPWGSARRE